MNTCQEINETHLGGDRIVHLTTDLLNLNTTCFTLDTSNFTFDCQNHIIEGNGSMSTSYYGIYASFIGGFINITLQNCEINKYKQAIKLGSYNKLLNLTFKHNNGDATTNVLFFYSYNYLENIDLYNNSGYGIYFDDSYNILDEANILNHSVESPIQLDSGSTYNSLSNLIIKNSSQEAIQFYASANYNTLRNFYIEDVNNGAIYMWSSNHNFIEDGTIINASYGIWLYKIPLNNISNVLISNSGAGIYFSSDNARYNRIANCTFLNNTNDIYFYTSASPYPTNNYFYGNYFSNGISSDDWTQSSPNSFNYSGIGNYYTNFNESNCTTTTNVVQSGCTYTVCTSDDVIINAANSVIDYYPIIKTSGTTCPFQTHPVIQTSQGSNSIFPFYSFTSFILIIVSLISYFISS